MSGWDQQNQWREWFKQEQIINLLETTQNLIVVVLAMGLFCAMVIRLHRTTITFEIKKSRVPLLGCNSNL